MRTHVTHTIHSDTQFNVVGSINGEMPFLEIHKDEPGAHMTLFFVSSQQALERFIDSLNDLAIVRTHYMIDKSEEVPQEAR